MKLLANYPTYDEEVKIVEEVSKSFFYKNKKTESSPIFPSSLLLEFRKVASEVTISKEITEYIVSIVQASRNNEKNKVKTLPYLSYIDFGASPRCSIALQSLSKINAMFEGRDYVTPDDVKKLCYPVLRHRLKLSYEAIAENASPDDVIKSILSIVPQP